MCSQPLPGFPALGSLPASLSEVFFPQQSKTMTLVNSRIICSTWGITHAVKTPIRGVLLITKIAKTFNKPVFLFVLSEATVHLITVNSKDGPCLIYLLGSMLFMI